MNSENPGKIIIDIDKNNYEFLEFINIFFTSEYTMQIV